MKKLDIINTILYSETNYFNDLKLISYNSKNNSQWFFSCILSNIKSNKKFIIRAFTELLNYNL